VQYIIVWEVADFKEIIFNHGKKGGILEEKEKGRENVEFQGSASNIQTKKTIQNLQNVNFGLTNDCHSWYSLRRYKIPFLSASYSRKWGDYASNHLPPGSAYGRHNPGIGSISRNPGDPVYAQE